MSKLEPLRVLVGVAPSGGEIRLVKYTDAAKELCFYSGLLSSVEESQFWKAKLRAERGGIENFEAAAAILVAAGWRVDAGNP